MDAARFDGWTKAFVASDRRRLLGGLLGLALATVPGASAGDNDPNCAANRKRGEACEKSCQCAGDYHCGKPRNTPAERVECGQHQNAKEVCCLGQGDTCGGNDCA